MNGIPTTKPSPSAQRAQAVLGMIRAEILNGTDHQALTHLRNLWPNLTAKEQRAVERRLRDSGYRGETFEMLKEWAFNLLHPADRLASPLRPKRGSGGPKPKGPEYWYGKRGGPVLPGGLPGLGAG